MFVARGFGERLGVGDASDMAALAYDHQGLRVFVARERNEQDVVTGLEVVFSESQKFRCLDEADIRSYSSSPGFVRGYHVVEVLQGGWSAECDELMGYEIKYREWLVVTGNLCVSVLSEEEPVVRQAHWHFDQGPRL